MTPLEHIDDINHAVDTTTFNYGRALGVPMAHAGECAPWDRKDAAAEYQTIKHYNSALGNVGERLTAGWWRIEMALRDVRNATTLAEQENKMRALRATYHEIERDLERIEYEPIKFYRYGRIGNVLKKLRREVLVCIKIMCRSSRERCVIM